MTFMIFRLEADFIFTRTDPSDPQLNEFLDRVDEHLVDKLDAQDVLIVSDQDASTFTVALYTEGTDAEAAFAAGLGTLRTAFHAENCNTASWPDFSKLTHAGLSQMNQEAGIAQPA
jgi:hypothetical protein